MYGYSMGMGLEIGPAPERSMSWTSWTSYISYEAR